MGDFWSSRIFFLAIWWAGYFFPFFPISFLLHLCCMQFFSSDKRLQEFFFQIDPPPPSRVNWLAPYCSLFLHINLCCTQFFVQMNYFELFLSAHFLFLEILNLNLTFPFAVYVKLKRDQVLHGKPQTAKRQVSSLGIEFAVCSSRVNSRKGSKR